MRIGSHDTAKRVFIIAEVGNNHEGDFGRAREMVTTAAEAGADAVKFQTITPERLVSALQTERIAQLTRFCLSYDQFADLAQAAGKAGVLFLSTPFDLDAVAWRCCTAFRPTQHRMTRPGCAPFSVWRSTGSRRAIPTTHWA